MNILALDTSSSTGSIALAKDDKIAYLNLLNIRATHSERLLPQIDQGLNMTGLSIPDLDLICLGNGPGSFTGIRIGLATAKGLCLGNQIPLLPFNTLEIIAANLYKPTSPILVMQDAKMNEIYAALYSSTGDVLIAPCNAEPEEFLGQIEEKVIAIGDAVQKYKSILEEKKINFETVLPHQNLLFASSMIGIVLERKLKPDFDLAMISDLEPYYLRRSQAEIVKENKLKQEN